MAKDSFPTLSRVVIENSVSDNWHSAVNEWAVIGLEEDPRGQGECVCGQLDLVKLFTIRNLLNDIELHPIGSSCVNLFGRADLDMQVEVFARLLRLKTDILDKKRIELTSEFFSRNVLRYLYEEGAFPDNQYNRWDGENDYQFLLDMFNKRNKEAISDKQARKIYGLLRYTVKPFILRDPNLK
jgi:hypothetical protein